MCGMAPAQPFHPASKYGSGTLRGSGGMTQHARWTIVLYGFVRSAYSHGGPSPFPNRSFRTRWPAGAPMTAVVLPARELSSESIHASGQTGTGRRGRRHARSRRLRVSPCRPSGDVNRRDDNHSLGVGKVTGGRAGPRGFHAHDDLGPAGIPVLATLYARPMRERNGARPRTPRSIRYREPAISPSTSPRWSPPAVVT